MFVRPQPQVWTMHRVCLNICLNAWPEHFVIKICRTSEAEAAAVKKCGMSFENRLIQQGLRYVTAWRCQPRILAFEDIAEQFDEGGFEILTVEHLFKKTKKQIKWALDVWNDYSILNIGENHAVTYLVRPVSARKWSKRKFNLLPDRRAFPAACSTQEYRFTMVWKATRNCTAPPRPHKMYDMVGGISRSETITPARRGRCE